MTPCCTTPASRKKYFVHAAQSQVLVGVEMGNGHCFIMPQWLEMNVDNRYIHSGINILRVHLLPPTLAPSLFLSLPRSPFSLSRPPKYFALGYALH